MIEKYSSFIGPYKVEVYKSDIHVTTIRFLQSDGFFELVKFSLPDRELVELYEQMDSALLWGIECLYTTPVATTTGDRYKILFGYSIYDVPCDDDPDDVYFCIYHVTFDNMEDKELIGSWMHAQEAFDFLLTIEPIVEDIKRCMCL